MSQGGSDGESYGRSVGKNRVKRATLFGVDEFDSSIGGLGGCPFAGNRSAAGNVCTEDLVFLCEEMGIDTGVDLEQLVEVARFAEQMVGHELPGKLMKARGLSRYRAH